MDLRKPFIETLESLVDQDDKTIFLTCDVGFSFLDSLKARLGDRFLNLGITESSTILTAAGLAKEGFRVYVYSMTIFSLIRPLEMIRVGVAMPDLNVKILGVSGSKAYAMLGTSHNLLHPDEDIDLCHSIGLESWVPDDKCCAEDAAKRSFNSKGAVYIRL